MTVSRRKFLKTGAMVSLAAVIPAKSAFARQPGVGQQELFRIPAGSHADPLDILTEETFSWYVNTKFRVYTSPLTVINLELIKVKRWERPSQPNPANAAQLDCFSVVFRGPRNVALESRTYRVEHDQMGSFDIFISPVDDRKKLRRYQAVFNRVTH